MNRLIPLITLLSVALLAQDATRTPQQIKAAFVKADRALNEAWAEAKKALPEDEFEELKEDQRAWVEHRDYLARSPMYSGASANDELALDSPDYLEAATGLTEARTEWLQGRLVHQDDETLTGIWDDSYGGRIEIVEKGGQMYFSLSVVRGPTSHVGELTGVARWNQTIGWFSDKGREEDKEEETNLAFLQRDKKLEIVGANTGHYHGARAYFDGDYSKVGTLTAKAQAKLIKAAKAGESSEPE